MSNVEWQAWDDQTVAQDDAAVQAPSTFLKLVGREDPYVIRFLPALKGETSFCKVVWQHYIDLPSGDRFVCSCPKMMERSACPVCMRIDALYRSGVPADENVAKKLSSKVRVFANVLDREHPEFGPLVLAYGKLVQEELVKLRKNPRLGGDLTNPLTGYDLEIYVTGQGINTDYKVYPSSRGTRLADTDEGISALLAAKHDLTRYARVLSVAEIEAGLAGQSARGARGGDRERDSSRLDSRSSSRYLTAQPAPTPVRAPLRGGDVVGTSRGTPPSDDNIPF